jgi:protein-tyrosine-phosphatase/DNA-binding transcriptional ArsR family regulator
MNIEVNDAVVARAAKHAALAEPARLAIVDALSLGDVSPSDLQAMLGMPSNLVAHHLKVLEGEGIVARTRSAADRRRSYIHLVPGALDGLLPSGMLTASRVVFVCTANSARSQLAVALWRRSSPVPAASAGTEPAERIDPGALAAARRHHLPIQNTRPRHLNDVLTTDDFVITVCDNAHEHLDRLDTATAAHWSVPDPVPAGTDAAFDAALDELTRRVSDLAPRLSAS